MIKFVKPKNLNGAELVKELADQGIMVNIKTSPFIDGNGDFWLDIKTADKDKAQEIVANHNGTTIAPDMSATRLNLLQKLGITEEEAKLLLS